MHPSVWKISPLISRLAAQMGAVRADPKMAIAALEAGAAVLVYPGGAEDLYKPYHLRHQIHFAGRQGFIKLALQQEVPIIPVISKGAHETLLILGDCYPQVQQLHKWGLPWLLGIDPVVFPIYLACPGVSASVPFPTFPCRCRFTPGSVPRLFSRTTVGRQPGIEPTSPPVTKPSSAECSRI